jgi:hypothetical protein
MHRKTRVTTTLLTVFFLFFAIFMFKTNMPSGQTIEWDFYQDVVFGLAGDVVRDFYREDLTPEYLVSLQSKIADLRIQLQEYERTNPHPSLSALDALKEVIGALDDITASVEGQSIPVAVKDKIRVLQERLHPYQTPEQQPVVAPLNVDINYVYRPKGEQAFKPLTDSSVLGSGDYYKIIFMPEENCYVYIFQSDSSDAIYQLFPMESFGGVVVNNFNPVEGGQTYYIPAEDKSFRLDNQIGEETFYFIVSRQRDEILEEQYRHVELAQRQQNVQKLEFAHEGLKHTMQTRGLASINADDNASEEVSWQENNQIHSVLRQRLEGNCNECINTLTFDHR